MTLFRSPTHRDVWQMRWCHTCFQPDEAARRLHGKDTQCPIWAKAMRTDRKPVEWQRNPRATDMEKTIKCDQYTSRPPIVTRRPVVTKRAKMLEAEEIPMFDVEPHDENFVPVDGWPDKPRKKGDVDHA